jgi:hypothetical protein
MITIILAIAAFYFFLVFVVARLAAPYAEFSGLKPPRQVPEEIKAVIVDLEARATDQRSYLEAAYELVMDKAHHQWEHAPGKVPFHLPNLFIKDLGEIWRTKKFIYCYQINYLLYVLLTGSKYFKSADVRARHVFLNFVSHNHLRVDINGSWINVDPAGAGLRGKPLGTYLAGFG